MPGDKMKWEIAQALAKLAASSEKVAAAFGHKGAIDPLDCGLCGERVPGEIVKAVWVVERTIEGRVLWAVGELWCPGCARLAIGLEAVRHVTLPKGKG